MLLPATGFLARIERLSQSFRVHLDRVEIHCNDDFYDTTGVQRKSDRPTMPRPFLVGRILADLDFSSPFRLEVPGEVWDSRPAANGGERFVYLPASCASSDIMQAYTHHFPTATSAYGTLNLMIICQKFLISMNRPGKFGTRRISTLRDREFDERETHINDIVEQSPVGCLLHELSHLHVLTESSTGTH